MYLNLCPSIEYHWHSVFHLHMCAPLHNSVNDHSFAQFIMLNLLVHLCMSFILNRRGPYTDPCGTPILILITLDLISLS